MATIDIGKLAFTHKGDYVAVPLMLLMMLFTTMDQHT